MSAQRSTSPLRRTRPTGAAAATAGVSGSVSSGGSGDGISLHSTSPTTSPAAAMIQKVWRQSAMTMIGCDDQRAKARA
ncbi:hypothetical protein [Streptomyces sp. KL116D]|uniref:hypothetical protein n=1 Tax=Streptomyces sp. KL116D TaxID=3045152 RepID=UPI003556F9BB